MTGEVEKSGGCLCGRVRYMAQVDPSQAYLCHCRMCQKATGGFAASFASVPLSGLQWGSEPEWFESSPFAQRPFCGHCGTPLGYRYREGATKMDITVGSFDDPSDFVPRHHFGVEHLHEAWLDTRDLPRYRADEYEALNRKWRDAGLEPPA